MALSAPWSFIQNATATSKAWLDPSDVSFKWTKSATDYIDHDGTNLVVNATTSHDFKVSGTSRFSLTSSLITLNNPVSVSGANNVTLALGGQYIAYYTDGIKYSRLYNSGTGTVLEEVVAGSAIKFLVNGSEWLRIASSQLTANTSLVMGTGAGIYLPNNVTLSQKITTGTYQDLIKINGVNDLYLWNGTGMTNIYQGYGASGVVEHSLYAANAKRLKMTTNYVDAYNIFRVHSIGLYSIGRIVPGTVSNDYVTLQSRDAFDSAYREMRIQASALYFYAGATEYMRITSGGSVQIGSSSGTNYGTLIYKNGTETALYVRQDSTGDIFHADDGGSGAGLKVKGDGTTWIIGTTSNAYFSATGYVLYFERAGANYVSASNASGTLYLQSGGSDSLVCDTGNDVAVGGFTTPTSTWLGSAGAVFGVAQGAGTRPVMLASGYGTNGIYSGALQFNMTINSSVSPNTFDKLGSTGQKGCAAITSGYEGGLVFYSYNGTVETAVTGVNLANNQIAQWKADYFSFGTLTAGPNRGIHTHTVNDTENWVTITHSSSGTTSTDGIKMGLSGSNGYLWNYESGALYLGTNNNWCWSFETNGDSNVVLSGARIGYGTGAGGTVTQITSRTTGVTINKACGAITMFSAAGSTTWASFTVTNSVVAATDTIVLSCKSSTNLYMFHVAGVSAGSFTIMFATTGGTATDAPVINFAVIKAVTS